MLLSEMKASHLLSFLRVLGLREKVLKAVSVVPDWDGS